MKLEKIITLANKKVQLPFTVMERSLRATGCTLPLWVIPYNEERFDLPANAYWLEANEVYEWLGQYKAHRMMRKYACLLEQNYFFIDTDAVFIRNPTEALKSIEGFVANCTHWNNPDHTMTVESQAYLKSRSTTYQKSLFNAGQFGCERALYTLDTLKAAAATLSNTCLTFPYHDQPGLNYLVAYSNVKVTNLTLPPLEVASSWAGDYRNVTKPVWPDEAHTPFVLHWAGMNINGANAIDELFYSFLTPAERAELKAQEKPDKVSLLAQVRQFMRGVVQSFRANFINHE